MGILENILVNKPKWSGTTDQIKNIIWKKMPVGKRRSLIGKKKRQKFSFEKRRSLGESTKRTPYQIAMLNFKSGAYGTPENPRRGALHRAAFWDAYHNVPTMKHVHGSIAAAHAKAGRDMAKLDKKKAQIKEAIKFIRTKGDEDSEHKIVGHNGEHLGTISRGWLRRGGSQWVVNRSDKPAKGYASLKLAKKALMNEDLIGKKTTSVEDIAKKHGLSVDQIKAQIVKGVGVEREHTSSDAEAEEIARDHLDEFPDYYDRLDKMETKAKKDMKNESKLGKARAYDVHLKGRHIDTVWFTGYDAEEARKSLINHDGYHPSIKVIDRGEESKYTHPREAAKSRVQKVREDAPAMSVASGAIAGMPTADSADKTPVRRPMNPLRRKKFAGKTVFVVDPTTYHKAHLGKRKYEHYEKYLEGCDIADYIREYGRKYWAEPIILENEQTGAMIYLKYGSK